MHINSLEKQVPHPVNAIERFKINILQNDMLGHLSKAIGPSGWAAGAKTEWPARPSSSWVPSSYVLWASSCPSPLTQRQRQPSLGLTNECICTQTLGIRELLRWDVGIEIDACCPRAALPVLWWVLTFLGAHRGLHHSSGEPGKLLSPCPRAWSSLTWENES